VSPDVVLLNSGGSNYTSLQAAFERLGARCGQSTDPARIRAASHVVLPGVGSAASAMQAIAENGLFDVIRTLRQPLLGICLGMQVLFEHSSESDVACLGLIPGRVTRLQGSPGIRVPHMGWNAVQSCRSHPLLAGLDGSDFYFVHSYAAMPSDASIALCGHGQDFSAAVAAGNVLGVQFHPERSGPQGQRLLANFLELAA
jgi:glutamine amidotransferase